MADLPSVKVMLPRGIFISKGKVLTITPRGESLHFLIGGRVESGESLKECLVREVREELDKPVTINTYVGAIEHYFENERIKQYEVSHFFLVDIPGLDADHPVQSNEEFLQFHWIDEEDFDTLNIQPGPLKDLLRGVLAGKKEPFWASTLDLKL